MLLRATLSNFLCFKGEASLSLVASPDQSHPSHVIEGRSKAAPRVLRAAALYGANGHGKTKFIDGLETLKRIVLEGCDEGDEYSSLTFGLDDESSSKPTVFTVEFNAGGVDYEYGIAVAEDHIPEEWLYSRPNVKEVLLFERSTHRDGEKFVTKVKPGRTLLDAMRGESEISPPLLINFLASGTRPVQPFLTEAVDRNIDALRPIFEWFREGLIVVGADAEFTSLNTRSQSDPEFLQKVSDFIRQADTGVDRVEVIEEPFDFHRYPNVSAAVRKELLENIEQGEVLARLGGGDSLVLRRNKDGELVSLRMIAIHRSDDGEYTFSIADESSGTQRLMHLAPIIFAMSNSDRTFFVDEIDRKLHPLLAYQFIQRFLDDRGAGQVVFTTHNTHLLDVDLLRRDEIWFVQKAKSGSSDIYSLSDLKVRGDLNLEKGYLNGRFGAIPFMGSAKDLGWV
jgi:hypothetical protein